MTMITPSYLGETIEYSSLHACRSTLEDPTQYEHVGVLIAEEVTARFLNVINLFNGFIPLVALQMTAIEAGEGIGLHFTKVVDALRLGTDDEEEGDLEPADRSYWEARGTVKTVKLADEILEMCKKFDPSLSLKYNRHYIGLARDGIAFNFIRCTPRKSAMNLAVKLPRSEEVDAKLEQSGLDLLEYTRGAGYRVKLEPHDIQKHQSVLEELLKAAYENKA